ncbi:hypothetical protein M3J09_011470 [Ascochyta lentis]
MEKLQVGSEQRAEDFKTEIRILRNYNTELEQGQRELEAELRTSRQHLSAAKAEIDNLNEDVNEQKHLCKEATAAKEALQKRLQNPNMPHKEAELNRTIKLLTEERDKLAKRVQDLAAEIFPVSVLQDAAKVHQTTARKSAKKLREVLKTQGDLESQLQLREAEIAELRRQPPRKVPKKDRAALKEAQKQTNAAMEAHEVAKEQVGNMFLHYDVLHGKNLLLVGKLTAMAQVGGFGNHNSIYRKELDALKGLPLEELDEYKARD